MTFPALSRAGFATLLILALSGFLRVLDGDTIDLDGVRYRIHGIDAPETRRSCFKDGREWQCGMEASLTMQRLAVGQVRCQAIEKDRYGRTVAKCYAGGVDLGRELVRRGMALEQFPIIRGRNLLRRSS